MGFSSPKPPMPMMPPPAAHPPVLASSMSSTSSETAKAAEGMGVDDTVKTSPQGTPMAPVTSKATLLGQ